MSSCCSSSDCKSEHPRKHQCPVSGIECAEVSVRTIAHHIKSAWNSRLNAGHYFFCDDPTCDVAYFGDDGSIVLKSQLRTLIDLKGDTLCYCFGVTKVDALNDSSIRDYVLTQTKLGLCLCETSHPSGRCCLKNFPRSSVTE